MHKLTIKNNEIKTHEVGLIALKRWLDYYAGTGADVYTKTRSGWSKHSASVAASYAHTITNDQWVIIDAA